MFGRVVEGFLTIIATAGALAISVYLYMNLDDNIPQTDDPSYPGYPANCEYCIITL